MTNRSANESEASGQFPLAELVAGGRRERGLSQAAVARLMHRAAEEAGTYCLASRQTVHEYEQGRIPYGPTLRLLASALGMPFSEVRAAADRLYDGLVAAGVEVLYDDRDQSPGVKFADADLLGLPTQLVLGGKGLARGVVERKDRASGERDEVALGDVVAVVSTR